jgi:hypothetical protein
MTTAPSPSIHPAPAPLLRLAVASLVLGILGMTCFSILAGLPAIVCGVVALVRISGARPPLRGQGLAIAGIVTGGLSVLMAPLLAALLLPAIASARGRATEVACMANVKQCAQACIQYASGHDGTLPSSWEDLGEFLEGAADATHCPALRGKAGPSYELLEGGRKLSEIEQPDKTAIVREIEASHRRGRTVGYADGSVGFVDGR